MLTVSVYLYCHVISVPVRIHISSLHGPTNTQVDRQIQKVQTMLFQNLLC